MKIKKVFFIIFISLFLSPKLLYATTPKERPFHTLHWVKIDSFKAKDIKDQLKEIEELVAEKTKNKKNDSTLSSQADALFSFINQYTSLTEHSSNVEKKGNINSLLTKCYALLLEHSSSDDTKQIIIETLASLSLSQYIPPDELRVLSSIKSNWRQYLFTAIANGMIKEYQDNPFDRNLDFSTFFPSTEVGNNGEHKHTTKEFLEKVIAQYISSEAYINLSPDTQKKLGKYLKTKIRISANTVTPQKENTRQVSLSPQFDDLRKKALDEITLIWEQLYPLSKELVSHSFIGRSFPNLADQNVLPSFFITLYLTSRKGKVEELLYKKEFKSGFEEAFEQLNCTFLSIYGDRTSHNTENKTKFITISDFDTALHCASQRPFTVSISSLALYTMAQASVLPKLNRIITDLNYFKNHSEYTLLGQQSLANTLTLFTKQNIPHLIINAGDSLALTTLLNILSVSQTAVDYFQNNEMGNKFISLSLYPQNGLALSNLTSSDSLKELNAHLSSAWNEFYQRAEAFKQVQEKRYSKLKKKAKPNSSERNSGSTGSQPTDNVIDLADIQSTENFANASLRQHRLSKKVKRSANSSKNLADAASIPPFDNGFAPIGKAGDKLYQSTSKCADKDIMHWSQKTIQEFEKNSLFSLHHYKFLSHNYLDEKELTREKNGFRPIEVIPEADSFVDTYETSKDYATLLLVTLRKTALTLSNRSDITDQHKEKLTYFIDSMAKKLISKHSLMNPLQLPTPLSIINKSVSLKVFSLTQKSQDDIKCHLDECYNQVKNLIAKSMESSENHLDSFRPIFPENLSQLKNDNRLFLSFYQAFQAAFREITLSKAFRIRVKHTPMFLDLSVMASCLPEIPENAFEAQPDNSNASVTLTIDSPCNDTTELTKSPATDSRTPVCLAWDFVNSLSAQIARNIITGDKEKYPDLVSTKEQKILELSTQKESAQNVNKILKEIHENLQSDPKKKKKLLDELDGYLDKLGEDNTSYKAIRLVKSYIPAALDKTYNFCNEASTYLNAGILALMVLNGISQITEGRYLDFIHSSAKKIFDLIPNLRALIPTDAMLNNGTASADYTNTLDSIRGNLTAIGSHIRDFGSHSPGTEKEFIKTPGSNAEGWIPVNAFTTVYVSILGILSVANGIITQYQTFQKLTESELLSLVNGKLDVGNIEQVLERESIPDSNKETLYTPSWGDHIKDAGAHLIQFNAHLKRGLRHALSFTCFGNGMSNRLPGSLLDYLLLPLSVSMSHVNQSVHARLHSYSSWTEFTKDAQVDRMVYSLLKLAVFDTVKPFIDTRVADATNLLVGMGILATDFPVATLAKSSLTRSIQVQIQHRANHDALKDYWEHDGKSVNKASHTVFGKLYGNGDGCLKNSIANIRPIEEAKLLGSDYDTQRKYYYSALGLFGKTLHGLNYAYNFVTYLWNPISAVAHKTADVSADKLAQSLSKQSKPYSSWDTAVHSINIARKAADVYFFGWYSPVSIKFISTGVGKVSDNLSMIANVHASMATFNRRATNHVVLADGLVGSFKDAVTGALNRLAISSNIKSFQTITGAVDQADTPMKEAATSYAQHRNLTMIPPAATEYTETAITKKVIQVLRSNDRLAAALDSQCSDLASSLIDLGYEGAQAISRVVQDSIKQTLKSIKQYDKLSTKTKSFSDLPTAIFNAKQQLAKATNNFMESPASTSVEQDAASTPVEQDATDNSKRCSINRLSVYVETLSDLLESGKSKAVKRFEVLQIYGLMAKEKTAFLEFLTEQSPLRTIRCL